MVWQNTRKKNDNAIGGGEENGRNGRVKSAPWHIVQQYVARDGEACRVACIYTKRQRENWS